MKAPYSLFILTNFLFACSAGERNETENITEAKAIPSPAGESSAEPFLYSDGQDRVYLSWIEKKENKSTLKFSVLGESGWSRPLDVASGSDWFVNWADYPVICADGQGNLIAHYLEKSDTATFAYDIKYVCSQDNGLTWSSPRILHDDGLQAEHGFVSIAPFGENYFATWLDGRNTVMEGDHSGHEGHHGEMTLRGALLNKAGEKLDEWELDNRVCDCCQTSVAITGNGPVVVYRDRSADEIRDISIVRWENGKWTEPLAIHDDQWKITGCPVNGPRIAAVGNKVAVAWFSMAENEGAVKIVFSDNGGASFQKPIRIDEGKTIGRVAIEMPDENSAIVTWMEGSSIKALRVGADGTKGDATVIASSSESRSAGFPQITLSGKKLLFAWTDNKLKKVNTAEGMFKP